jgi:photosystem II stability/assembly factor-like uncharacterized protein
MKIIAFVFVALSLLIPQLLMCQWQQTNGPFGGPVNTMIVSGTSLLAGTNIGAFRSTNEGATWTFVGPAGVSVSAFCINGTTVFAGTSNGVYRTSDGGVTWTGVNTGLTKLEINAMAFGGGFIFAGTDDGIFRSTDNGGTWSASGTFSMPVTSLAVVTNSVGATLVYAGCYYSYSNSALFFSSNAGTTWTKLAIQVSNYKYFDTRRLAVAGSRVYGLLSIGYNKTLFTIDYQSAPSFVNPNAPANVSGLELIPYSGPNQTELYFRDKTSLYRFHPSDLTTTNLGSIAWSANCYVTTSSGIFVGTSSCGVLKSTDDGNTWILSNNGMFNSDVAAIALTPRPTSGNNLLASSHLDYLTGKTTASPVYRSTNDGDSWNLTDTLPSAMDAIVTLKDASGKNMILAATWQGIFRSTDDGLTWRNVNPDLRYLTGLVAIGNSIFTTMINKVYRSIDYGYTWIDVSQGLDFVEIEGIGIGVPSASFTSLFCITHYALFRSRDNGATWARIAAFGNTGAAMRGCGQALFLYDEKTGVRRSTDDGDMWISVNNGLSSLAVKDLAVCGTKMFAATDSDGVFMSLDYGENWSAVNAGLPTLRTTCLAGDSTKLYVGTKEAGVLRYQGDLTPAASLAPVVTEAVVPGAPFWVEVKIGDPNAVKDLAYISFHLSSNTPLCQYVDSSAVYGPFLVKVSVQGIRIVPSSLYWKPDAQTVSISLSKTMGTSGSGIVAKAQFQVLPGTTSVKDVTFSFSDVKAMDPAGNSIELAAGKLSVHVVVGGGEVWPGDCDNNGVVNAADVLPIGVYYGQTINGSNFPGMQWKGYTREGWPNDTPKKKICADANGDGSINSADVLAVGLNYGKTHQPVVLGKTVSPQLADGAIQVGSPETKAALGSTLRIPITLTSSKPVYGIAFNLKYGTNSSANASNVKLLRVDTASSMLGGGLMVSRISDEDGLAEIGLTKTRGVGATQGVIMKLVFEAPSKDPLWVEVSNVKGNDEHGNAVNLSGSVFRSDAAGPSGSSSIPTENALLQNYPNPFNPATSIRFQLSDASMVSIKMFDILGREVVTLVNEERAAGSYTVRWDATGVPSGIYCCRLAVRNQAGQMFMQTRRMTFVK